MSRWFDRALFALLLTLAMFGAGAIGCLLAHVAVPDWLLPACAVVAVLVPRRTTLPPASRSAPPRARIAAAATLAVLVAALAYGSLATASRHWDGAVAWDAKAQRLADAPTLEQPYFRDTNVFCHSRDYPLLQPVLIATIERSTGAGRLVFVLAFAIAVAALGLALLRRTGDERIALGATLAFALTPNLVNPTSGGFDSGYADGLLCACITVAAAGVIAGDRIWLALGLFLAVLTKPEGLPYGGAFVAAVWLVGDGGMLRAATVGWLAAATLQLSLQHDLATNGTERALPLLLIGCAVLGAAVLGSDRWLVRRAGDARLRTRLGLLMVALLLVVGPLLAACVGDVAGSFGAYLNAPSRLWSRLERLPAVLAGFGEFALWRGAFGLTWLLPPCLWLLTRRLPNDKARRVLGVAMLLFVAVWIAAFLLSPIEDLQHHLRSTLPRLLDHATGAAWLFSAACWHRLCAASQPH
ncbi:MAG: hypothetical protein H6838_10295 [Planctomycetes bacterium]|nr:hypothetical protein [Planctomycetota bacterium]